MKTIVKKLLSPWLARVDARLSRIVDTVVRAHLPGLVREVVAHSVPAAAQAIVPATVQAVVPATLEAHSPLLWTITGQAEALAGVAAQVQSQAHLANVKLDNLAEELDLVLNSLVREIARLQRQLEAIEDRLDAGIAGAGEFGVATSENRAA